MAFVITRLCRDCVDMGCVDVCPTECIVQHRPAERESELPNQLFIDPGDCIHCRQCEPECPWEAIFDEDHVPALFHDDIALNALARNRADGYDVPLQRLTRKVERAEVEENKERWGLEARAR